MHRKRDWRRALRAWPLWAALALPLACSPEADGAQRASAPREQSARAAPAAPTAELLGPAQAAKLRAAQQAYELGQFQSARSLLSQAGGDASVGALLLDARLAQAAGDAVAAWRQLEAARARAPRDARVFADAAELSAQHGKLDAAEREIQAGLELAGDHPELARARGVYFLSRSGGAVQALAELERALELDPALPYARAPLFHARVLAGRAALSERDAERALELARAALELEPRDADARELQAEALGALGEHEQAVLLYEELHAEGRELGATLALAHQRAATRCLLAKRREDALAHYLRARACGASEEQLGLGAQLLRDESARALELARAARAAGDAAGAAAHCERALELAPASLEAEYELGIARFELADYEAAARSFERVLDALHARGQRVVHPAHLNLARAWYQLGRRDDVRHLLERELTLEPQGEWAPELREMLAALGAKTP